MNLPDTALSVRQPWAWAIFHGKDVENRSAAAVRHGMKPARIAIHAAQGMTRDEYEDAADFMRTLGVECPHPSALIRGAIIGVVTVTAIVKEHPSPWFFGPRGLVLADAVPVEPIRAVGALGYFKWRPRTGRAIEVPGWMLTYPDGRQPHRREKRPAPMPLFGT